MKFIRPLCTLVFGLAVLLFFGLAYPHHLHYQEQFQLFLFDSTLRVGDCQGAGWRG